MQMVCICHLFDCSRVSASIKMHGTQREHMHTERNRKNLQC
jgi:hypothetical protein